MPPHMGSSISLPSLELSKGRSQALLDLPGFRHTYVGGACIARAKMVDRLRLVEDAHTAGNLPLLRTALSRAGDDSELKSRNVVVQSSKELGEAKKWMIACENAYRSFQAESMGQMFKAVHELEKLSLGPMIWKDPMHPKLRRVHAITPYFSTLRVLSQEHRQGARAFSAAWAAAVEANSLNEELTALTAKWFRPLPDALAELNSVLNEDEEVRFTYGSVHDTLLKELPSQLEAFGVDTSRLKFRVASGTEEFEMAAVITGPGSVLGRIRRLNAGKGDPALAGRLAALETPAQKQQRVARLLELSGLEEVEEKEAAPAEAGQPSLRREYTTTPDPAPPRASTLAWLLAQRERRAERRRHARRKREEEENRSHVAVQTLSALKHVLTKKFGSLNAAWKQCLDIHGNGRVSFAEFCRALHEVGFMGVFEDLWEELDTDKSGFITLDEFDLKVHDILAQFDSLVTSQYGSYAEAWKSFDEDGNGMLTESEFTSRCQTLGYKGNSRKLYKFLLASPSSSYIKMSDFAPEAFQQSGVEKEDNPHLSNKERVELEKKEMRASFTENSDVPSLKRTFVNKYGSLSTAWKYGLDLDGSGKITFAEFSKAVRQIGFGGNIKSAWAELNTDGSSDISLQEWDPRAHKVLSSFTQHVRETYGGHLEAWQALGVRPASRVDKSRFSKMCQDMGFEGSALEVFKHLPLQVGMKSLTLADLDSRALNESHLDMEKNSRGTRKEQVEAWRTKDSALDRAASDLPAFRRVLLSMYGTVTAAWKHCLDPDGNGRVTYAELANAARGLGYKGKLKDLWVELDKDGNGTISLGELDAQADAALTSFRELVLSKYTDFIEAWKFFDSKKNMRIDEATFVQKCQELGYEGSPHQLFKYLLDDPSRDNITLADLDAEAAHEAGLDPDRFELHMRKREQYERQQEWHRDRGKYISDVPSLMRLLVNRYGSLIQAWKHGMDTHGNNRISFMEFARALQELAVAGNFKELWASLDGDGNGVLTLEEFDPKAHRALSEFRQLLLEKHGSFSEAWGALDVGKKRRLSEEELVERCSDLGYEGDARQLFRYLADKPESDFITLHDLDAQTAHELTLDLEHSDKGERGDRKGATDLASLRQLLSRRYGTLTAAWKHCLDPAQKGWVGFVDFCKAMRHVGFVGGLRGLWAELAKDSKGHVTLEAFDPEAYAALEQFGRLVVEKHGNFLNAWAAMDENKTTFLEMAEFEQACAKLGFEGDVKKLFRNLLDEPCFDRLTLDDLDLQAAHEARFDPHRNKDGSHKKALLEREAQEEIAKRKEVRGLAQVKTELLNRFGTITAAWKHGFDTNADGYISYQEFCQGLREINFRGPVRDLWGELDKQQVGRISLADFDPQVDKILSQFTELVLEKFTSFREAWSSCFDPNGNGRLDEASFAKACEKLEYAGNAGKLYKLLLDQPMLNSHWITEADVEPHHLKKRGRAAEDELRKELNADAEEGE